MKKTLISLATASLIASTAMAADKGIDIVTTGQAVVYYETNDNNGLDATTGNDETSLFDRGSSAANVGVQLNLNADLGNNFTFGSQISYLGTAGLEKDLVGATKQTAGDLYDTTNELALTKVFVAKKVGNTTVKIGRQELPKSLSPLAFSEGWNAFKNTFDAILLVNSDIQDTTLVGAYVGKSTGMGLDGLEDLTAVSTAGDIDVNGAAYMLTAQNKSIPMTTVTASYYSLSQVGQIPTAAGTGSTGIHADALWVDAKIAGKDLPLGLKVGLQAGSIMPDSDYVVGGAVAAKFTDTTAFGAKVSLKPVDALSLCAAFTSVDGADIDATGTVTKHAVAIKNTGTGVKTPLYTQMIANQDAIALDGDTFMLKAAYSLGDNGTVIVQGTYTAAGKSNANTYTDNAGREQGNDYTDLELVYKLKSGGVQYFAAYVNQTWDSVDFASVGQKDKNDKVRVWARYAF